MSDPNPCLDWGVRCVNFRVSFYWGEGDDAPGGSPNRKCNEQRAQIGIPPLQPLAAAQSA
ncbi:hypothetical protein [Aromatoleum petrolei]|uniref:Uncharacterized protein n=1 Tax=Aromatoleum petrolei TaxID=76116 RepID=A0ABX1MPQ0_9RHOO|nr:hypothetical protein [Aromatoleum petrolei]NMF88320.1 hypothetical protein [Aromatoleum petrolei]QTQ37981.1 Uncharacterized protein ToN1_38770 [Aromatoleum petrolei]